MEASTKKILGTLAAVAAVGGGFYLIKKGKKLLSGAKMNFALLGFRIHKMNLQEVQFAVKLRCYNPTKAPITLAVNQVVANYKGSAIAYSTPDIKGLTIGAGKTQEPEILFQVPYLNLMGKGLNLTALSNTKQLKKDMSFTMSISVNGETLTTTQSLSKEQHMNGLGELGIVSGPRNTQNGKKFNHLIKKANGQDTFIKNGNVLETVESCIDTIGSHFKEVEELASLLKGDTLKETCRNIFNFSYTYLQYHKDDDGTEQLRTPSRSWLDGQIKFKQKGRKTAGIDCDDYSIFVGSLLKCLSIPFKLRITKYDGKKNFQHIYVIVPALGDSEDEIVIDPVLSKFDYQKPYSFERSDFDMSPLQLAELRGIDGLTGSSALGLPISVLSGIDLTSGHQAQADHEELIAIVSGIDFDETVNGLGEANDATYRYLVRTRNFLKKEDNRARMAHIQNPTQFISMLDQAIKFWNTPKRDAVLEKLSDIEEKLAQTGLIQYDSEALQGLAELDAIEEEVDGEVFEEVGDLGFFKRKKGKRRGGFFRSIKRIGKKIGKGIKRAGKKVGKVAKKVVKAIVRFNPLTIAIRGGLLAALRLNMFGIAKKLQYAYLPTNLANKYNIDHTKLIKIKKVHARVIKLFRGLQGKEQNLRNAIIKGAKQKSADFSLKGMDGLLGDLQTIESMGELAELGTLGAVATAASVTAASGVLAKIGGWLKPIKNLFSKVKSKFKKKAPALPAPIKFTKQQARNTQAYTTPTNTYTPQSNNTVPQPSYSPQPILKSGSYTPQTIAPTPMVTAPKKGISKGAKIGIGLGVAALLGTGAYLAFRKKDDKPKRRTSKASSKQDLGSIALQ